MPIVFLARARCRVEFFVMNAPEKILPPADSIRIVKGTCPHDCPDTCALQVTVENGRAIKVEGDPHHPTTDGVLCAKVSKYPERTYHRDRLTQPLKRVSAKNAPPVFEPISWTQAISEIAARLQAIAARDSEAILPYSYAGTMGYVQGEGMAARFFNALGAARLDRTVCASAGSEAMKHTLGASVGMDVEQFQNAELIILWGTNPITSSVHLWARVQEAKRQGAKIIAIDPFRSDAAEKCHQHIALLPGTDAALALSIAHVLISENLIDHDYVQQHTLGFDELAARAAQYQPSHAAQICGITESEIVELARLYGRTKKAAIRLNYGLQRVRGGANSVRAILCLPALTGAWREAAGGALLSTSGYYPMNVQGLERPDLRPDRFKLAGRLPRLINMSLIGDALLEQHQPIEALIVYNSNPVAIAPDSEKVIRGFSREDLFTVVLEHFQTDTADYADYVLPATTQLEHFDVHKSYGHWYIMANHPAIEPIGQAKPNSEIFRLLAKAMGFDHPALKASDQEIGSHAFNWSHPRLSHTNYAELLREGWVHLKIDKTSNPFARGGFPTASGKVEFFSESLKNAGHDPLPDYIPPYEPPTANFPLQCISPPARNFLNSSFVNIDSLRKTDQEPQALLHPEEAELRNLSEGDAVEVFNQRGSIQVRLKITERVRPGMLVVPSIWWHKMTSAGKNGRRNVNALTSQRLTDLGNAPTFYDCAVQVRAWDSKS